MPPPAKLRVEITFLEMTSRPAGDPLPPPEAGLEIRHVERPSVALYRHLYDTVGERWLWFGRRRLSDQDLEAIITDRLNRLDVIYVEGEPAGFAETNLRTPREVELSYFGIMPDFIGRKLGPYLLSHTIHAAWDSRPRRMWVQTCTLDHPAALPMYKRLGFVPFRQAVEFWDDPRATGLIRPDVEARVPFAEPNAP